MSERTIFVIGGAGYVGSHCARHFAELGWKVVVFDNLSRGWRDFVRWGGLIEGDILDLDGLSQAMAAASPDVVAHFAAVAYVGESMSDPGLYFRNNMAGTLNVLDAMGATGVSGLLFSSTCATYGVPERLPIDEDHPQAPINPYGWSKLAAEKMIAAYHAAHGVNAVILRYFNAAGAHPDGNLGERHEPETHVIPLAVDKAVSGAGEFEVFGTDFDTRDGSAIRDYIHVSDLADAHARAIDYLLREGGLEVFNIGTGHGTTVLEIADAVDRVAGTRIARRLCPRRAGDPPVLVAAADKAQRLLGWKATRSDILSIVETAWRWHRSERPS